MGYLDQNFGLRNNYSFVEIHFLAIGKKKEFWQIFHDSKPFKNTQVSKDINIDLLHKLKNWDLLANIKCQSWQNIDERSTIRGEKMEALGVTPYWCV